MFKTFFYISTRVVSYRSPSSTWSWVLKIPQQELNQKGSLHCPKGNRFPRYNMKCSWGNVISTRNISCSIMISTTFHVKSRKFFITFRTVYTVQCTVDQNSKLYILHNHMYVQIIQEISCQLQYSMYEYIYHRHIYIIL